MSKLKESHIMLVEKEESSKEIPKFVEANEEVIIPA